MVQRWETSNIIVSSLLLIIFVPFFFTDSHLKILQITCFCHVTFFPLLQAKTYVSPSINQVCQDQNRRKIAKLTLQISCKLIQHA